MKKLLIGILLSASVTVLYAQKEFKNVPKIPITREVILNHNDTIVKARIFTTNPVLKKVFDKTYTWYNREAILQTVGGWSGKLLEGTYEVFYPNKNLQEQGMYESGWKEGLWRNWYPSGKLQQKKTWKKGMLHGAFEVYAMDGSIVEKGCYKKGKLQGVVTKIVDGKETQERYRKGVLLVKKAKKKKTVPKKKKSPKKDKETQKKSSNKSKKTTKKTKKVIKE